MTEMWVKLSKIVCKTIFMYVEHTLIMKILLLNVKCFPKLKDRLNKQNSSRSLINLTIFHTYNEPP